MSGYANRTGQADRRSLSKGPCYVKVLVTNTVAGAIIGKNGKVISQIEQDTNCVVKLSPATAFYPGTNERVVGLSGELKDLNEALYMIIDKVRDVEATAAQGGGNPENFTPQTESVAAQKLSCKLLVPKSAVSALIGKGGHQIRELQDSTGSRIQASHREEGIPERIISITGYYDSLKNAVSAVASAIQVDPYLRDHMHVVYGRNDGSGMLGQMHGGGMGGQPGLVGMGGGGGGGMGQMVGAFGGYGGPMGYGGGMGMGGSSQDMLGQSCEILVQVPDASIGSIIGKNGATLSEIVSATGARIQISQKGEYMPGTNDRKVCVSGNVGAVHNAHLMLLTRLENASRGNVQLTD